MLYLLDTCALIWLGMGGGKFSQYGVTTIC